MEIRIIEARRLLQNDTKLFDIAVTVRVSEGCMPDEIYSYLITDLKGTPTIAQLKDIITEFVREETEQDKVIQELCGLSWII